MSSSFISDSSDPKEPSRPKRPRSSLACIRCRKKKVKCDFVQPTCSRCAVAGLPCSYATPSRRVDGHAFDQLGDHVEELKARMQRMQSELAMMKNNLHPFSGANNAASDMEISAGPSTPSSNNMVAVASETQVQQSNQPVTWKLSLSPSGLRIDTNIASVADLYRILLNGISQLNINNDSNTTNLFSTDSIRAEGKQKSSSNSKNWRGLNRRSLDSGDNTLGRSNKINTSGRLWEVDDSEARKILQEKPQNDDSTLPKETLDNLMHTCYHKCFLAYQIVDQQDFTQRYATPSSGIDPLLSNSINAWVSKHGCIYHGAGDGSDPSVVGEAYFKNARQLLKKCFDISSPNTIQALLNLYMYQLSSERSSLAYLYIGLAIRMAQDLKFHKKEHMPADLKQRETNKRLWWSAYWLDLCAALESNRPTMVDDKDCDLEYPTKLDSEDEETGYRISFSVHSIKLMKIRKDITKHLPSEQSGQSLLSAISRLETALTGWLNELPHDLRYEAEDTFERTGSFRDEACLVLNIQYQTTWIMLHKFFLPKQDQTATPVALLSLNICTKSANFITKMLDIYAKNLPWCHYLYALDGLIASVTIHQVNAFSQETEVAHLAQRSLIITANILRDSPLIYMEKVNEIIDSIEEFLKKNQFPTDINSLPPIDEEQLGQQSLSSVFHPPMLEQQRAGSYSPAVSNSHLSNADSPSVMSSPRPQVSKQHMPSRSTFPTHQYESRLPDTTSTLTSPIPMSMSPQQQPVLSENLLRQHTQQQQQIFMQPPQPETTQTDQPPIVPNTSQPDSLMVGTSIMLNDPSQMMGFNLQNNTENNGDMNNLLFRDMNFDMTTTFQPNMFMDGRTTATSQVISTNFNATTNNFDFTEMYNNNTTSYVSNPALYSTTTASNFPVANQEFDPASLFNQMDQNAVNALLYSSGGNYNQFGLQDSNFVSNESNVNMYGSSRKRTNREWEDSIQ
ncbi:hypothetical protein K501DRAFT_207450 [Backusella circina FSU 941]|nr:hypothetical protein K501DRAFT_207450 [Backusella circina FSU 941]